MPFFTCSAELSLTILWGSTFEVPAEMDRESLCLTSCKGFSPPISVPADSFENPREINQGSGRRDWPRAVQRPSN